jgi:hypothetical protein
LKALEKGYNFASNLIIIKGLRVKLCTSKVAGVLGVRISGFPLGSPKTKRHLNVTPVERRKIYYKGENGGFTQVQAMVNLVTPRLPVVRSNTKSVPTMH